MGPDTRDGLHERAHRIYPQYGDKLDRYFGAEHTWRGSAGDSCPHCGLQSTDYGPISLGYTRVFVHFTHDPDYKKWWIEERWVPLGGQDHERIVKHNKRARARGFTHRESS